MVRSLAFVALLAGAASASAQNLVVNGDFSTGDFTGWNVFGNPYHYDVAGGFAYFGAITSHTYISQYLGTAPGAFYKVEFDLRNDGAGDYIAFFGDNLLAIGSQEAFGWTHFSSIVPGQGSTTQLSFGFMNPSGYYSIDNISVTQAVPEPASMAALGFGALALLRRRRSA